MRKFRFVSESLEALLKITRHVSQGISDQPPLPFSIAPPPFVDSHRQRACPRRHYYRRGCGCGSSWATSSFRAATNSFRHRKLGRKQSMAMPPASSPTSLPPPALHAALGPASLCLLHSHISSGRRRRRQLRPSVN